MLLSYGDTGSDVAHLQRQLKRVGYDIAPDGDYGRNTRKAVAAYQKANGLVVDGVAGPATLRHLNNEPPANATLQQSDMMRAAQALDVDLACVMAVTEVEAHGEGFVAPNRPVILFERHVMRRRMIAHGYDTTAAENAHPDLVNSDYGGYEGGLDEHIRLIEAQGICAPAAPESCSWGLFQIMGTHWETLGYNSVYEFARLMSKDEAEHLQAFVRFIQVNTSLHEALKNRQWADFAYGYNGPAYERNNYDVRLALAFDQYNEDEDLILVPKQSGGPQ